MNSSRYKSEYLTTLSELELKEAEDNMREDFNDFLESDFMLCKPYELSDDQVWKDLETRTNRSLDRTGFFTEIDSLCAKYKIISIDNRQFIQDNEDNSQTIHWQQMLCCRGNNTDHRDISLRTFRVKMHPWLNYSGSIVPDFETCSTFNQKSGNEAISSLLSCIGKEVLLDYSIRCRNEYNWPYAIRLSEIINSDTIRNHILLTQAYALNMAIKYPEEVTLGIRSKSGRDDSDNELSIIIGKEFRPRMKDLLERILHEIKLYHAGQPDIF